MGWLFGLPGKGGLLKEAISPFGGTGSNLSIDILEVDFVPLGVGEFLGDFLHTFA